MSEMSTLESAVAIVLNNNYIALVILTAIGYDYILTFSSEVEYIWVSTLYLLVRYFGLCGITMYILLESSLLPDPEKMYVFILHWSASSMTNRCHSNRCETFFVMGSWAFFVFIFAADLAMILRVWALYSRSRIILVILLTLYVAEIIPFIVTIIIYFTSGKFTVAAVQVFTFSFCSTRSALPAWSIVNECIPLALATVMCLLVIARFIRESMETSRSGRRWGPSRYLNLFTREGILYFFFMLLFQLIDVLSILADIKPTGWQALVVTTLEFVPVFTLTPRFILGLRALYARDAWDGRGSCDMDTGFGLSTTYGRGGSAMVFADVGQDEGIQMVEREVQDMACDA